MATYIVDASVVIERLIKGPYTSNARTLFNRLNATDRLVVPEFCLLEPTNVLWKQVRFQGMPEDQAEVALKNLRALPLQRVPVKALLNTAMDIGLTHQLAIYDSVYIALASRTKHPLITIDRPQERAAIAVNVELKSITDF